MNVLRLSLHPDGLALGIEKLAERRHCLLERLQAEAGVAGVPALADLQV